MVLFKYKLSWLKYRTRLFMKISLIKDDIQIGGPYWEAEQDMGFELLSENPGGLISCGQAACYAVIVKSKEDVALAHQSSVNIDCIEDMIDAVAGENLDDVSIVLAKSPYGYTIQWNMDKQYQEARHRVFDDPPAELYFSQKDPTFLNEIAKKFPKIPVEIIEMKHDFLIISSEGNVDLFKHHDVNKIEFRNEAEGLASQEPPPAQLESVSSSFKGFFSGSLPTTTPPEPSVVRTEEVTGEAAVPESRAVEHGETVKRKPESDELPSMLKKPRT